MIRLVRGKGLLNAVVIDESYGVSANELCYGFKERGLLAKPTHGNIIRFAPPLVLTEDQLMECVSIISDTFSHFTK
jgi:ornithine--oxo-acid transaminase